MSYPEKVDPARIFTMADLELSLALASTLVTFNSSRETVAGLAERWQVEGSNLKFTLKNNLKWSDGSDITTSHYKTCLERANKNYGTDLQALFGAIESVEAPDARTLVIKAKAPELIEGIVLKLTEPMYGLLGTTLDGLLDLKRSSGPYSLKSIDQHEMKMAVNRNWFSYRAEMADSIDLRAPPKNADQVENFSKDDWANLVVGSSIQRDATRDLFKTKAFSVWERVSDKLFALYPSSKFLHDGGASVMKQLDTSLNSNAVMTGLSGYTPAEQFFPRGYTLWTPNRKKGSKQIAVANIKSLRIIIPASYKPMNMDERLPAAISKITGTKVSIEYVPLNQVDERMKKQDYDILATGIAVADPNFEGAVSFFVEREPPFIPSGEKPNNFAQQVKAARGLKTNELRANEMRKIMSDAQNAGHVVPLFHFSSFSVAKNGVDISTVPSNDETIVFAKVRMK